MHPHRPTGTDSGSTRTRRRRARPGRHATAALVAIATAAARRHRLLKRTRRSLDDGPHPARAASAEPIISPRRSTTSKPALIRRPRAAKTETTMEADNMTTNSGPRAISAGEARGGGQRREPRAKSREPRAEQCPPERVMPRLSRSRSHPKTLRRGFAAATSSLSRVSKRAQRLVAATVDRPKLQALALMLLTWLALATVPEKATGQIVTSENTIWSATLTAGQTSDTLTTGYADGTYTHNAMGSLTNTMFTYAGIRYTVNELVVHDIAGTYQLDFVLDKTWSHTNTALVMGSNAVALSGFIGGAFSTQVIEVPTDWDNNDVIAVKIVGGPDIQSIGLTSQPSGRNHYAVGDTVTATVRFSQPVHITGTPQLTLDFAGNSRTASCAASTARTTIVCSYTVTATDSAKTGIGIATDSLSLNGGTIKEKDAMGTPATLNHNAVRRSSQHKIDHPGPVQNLRAQAGYDKIILWWDEPSYLGTGHGSFLFYYQYQYKEGTGNWGPWTSTGGTGLGKVISGLTNGTSYSFRVRTRTWNAIGQQSSEVTGSPAPKFRLGVSSNGFREGSSRGVTAAISITDGYVLDAPQTFTLEWLGAAVAGTYYMHDDNPATITLPAGSIHASVVLRAKHTGSPDYDVPVESELVAKYQGNVIGRQPLTLYDNDPEPVVTLSTSATEVNEGSPITLTATLSAKTNEPVFVFLNIGNPNKRPLTGIPKELSTYPNRPGMVFVAGQQTKSFTIQSHGHRSQGRRHPDRVPATATTHHRLRGPRHQPQLERKRRHRDGHRARRHPAGHADNPRDQQRGKRERRSEQEREAQHRRGAQQGREPDRDGRLPHGQRRSHRRHRLRRAERHAHLRAERSPKGHQRRDPRRRRGRSRREFPRVAGESDRARGAHAVLLGARDHLRRETLPHRARRHGDRGHQCDDRFPRTPEQGSETQRHGGLRHLQRQRNGRPTPGLHGHERNADLRAGRDRKDHLGPAARRRPRRERRAAHPDARIPAASELGGSERGRADRSHRHNSQRRAPGGVHQRRDRNRGAWTRRSTSS